MTPTRRASVRRRIALEDQLERELYFSTRERLRRLAEGSARQVALRSVQVHRVEDVECLGSELNARRSTRELERLEQRQVGRLVVRPAVRVPRQVAERPAGRAGRLREVRCLE